MLPSPYPVKRVQEHAFPVFRQLFDGTDGSYLLPTTNTVHTRKLSLPKKKGTKKGCILIRCTLNYG